MALHPGLLHSELLHICRSLVVTWNIRHKEGLRALLGLISHYHLADAHPSGQSSKVGK